MPIYGMYRANWNPLKLFARVGYAHYATDKPRVLKDKACQCHVSQSYIAWVIAQKAIATFIHDD